MTPVTLTYIQMGQVHFRDLLMTREIAFQGAAQRHDRQYRHGHGQQGVGESEW